MEPEAKLIAAQAAEELARQQATGQVDEVQRARMAQQILGGAAQQAKAREAQQQAADFQRMKQLGDVVAKGEMESRLRDYQRGTERLSGGLQAATGALSAGAGMFADYLGQQEGLKKGLQAAEAKGGVQGAIDFLNANPDYDPGEETLQRLYAGSRMGKQDASIDAVERELLQEKTLADIELRKRNQRAVEALNKQADDFMRVQAARQLEQDVADDMAMAALRRADAEAFRQSQANQIAVDALNRDADRFLLSQELQNFAPERTTFSPTLGDADATPVMNTAYSGESKMLPFIAATRALGDPNAPSLREQRLRRLAREQAAAEARARTAMGQSVSDSFPLRSPTLEDRLRLLQALGL
jgi:hypothetical protein